MPERRDLNFLKLQLLIAGVIMAKASHLVYFILMKDSTAEKKTKQALKIKSEQTPVLKGSLWCLDSKEFQDIGKRNKVTLRSAETKELTLTSELQDITKLKTLEFKLLLALTTCKERDALHSNNKRLMDVCRLFTALERSKNNKEEQLRVEVKDEDLDPISGTLVYIGEIPGRSGYWFGVEMDPKFHDQEISNTDGCFDKTQVFRCTPRSGLLVTANKIYPEDVVAVSSSSFGRDCNSRAVEHSERLPLEPSPLNVVQTQGAQSRATTVKVEFPKPDLMQGERVVWFDEKNIMQLATVKWIGILEDQPNQYTIGVENDKPVGSGTGFYKNKKLFETDNNYASLIPADGLLKAEVYFGSKDLIPPPPGSSREALAPRNLATVSDELVCWDDEYCNIQSHSDSGTLTNRENVRASNRLHSASYDQLLSSSALHQRDRSSLASGLELRTSSLVAPYSDIQFNRFEQREIQTERLDRSPISTFSKFHPAEFDEQENIDVTDVGKGGKEVRKKLKVVQREEMTRSSEILGEEAADVCPTSETGQMRETSSGRQTRNRSLITPLAGSLAGPVGDWTEMAVAERSGTADDFVPVALDAIIAKTDLDIGSLVEVEVTGFIEVQYGVIRWMGYLKDREKVYVGVELEEENAACTDGSFRDLRLFTCAPKKGFFTPINRVRRDRRFAESSCFMRRMDSSAFGSMECDEIPGVYPHQAFQIREELVEFFQTKQHGTSLLGRNMGIQGHHNSCYLDVTLFSMFAFSSAFDTILHRVNSQDDIRQYSEIQRALRDGVVNPLRCQMFVRADKVLRLRRWLSQCSSVQGLMDEEKDPDEFLISLLQETMRVEPFLKFSSGQSGYCYQLFIEKDDKTMPTTQQLLSLSLFQSDIKFVEVPRCLILQMPRFGRDFQMYKRIIPSLTLDITNMLAHDPQPCCFCGKLAATECRDCFLEFGKGFDRAYFCDTCIRMSHSPSMRVNHHPKELDIYPESREFYSQPSAPEIRTEVMELFAVICIKTSHYVTFTKCGSNSEAPWVFFDSMADRIGQQHGHNVPQLEICHELPHYLSEENRAKILSTEDKDLPERMRRLLCDGYICMYQSQAMEPYR